MGITGKKEHLIYAVAIAAATFVFFNFFYPYHLFFKEQFRLFLYTPGYLLSYFDKPAWLAQLAGDFLTQFNYLKGGGPLVLALLFTTEWLLIRRVIEKTGAGKNAVLWALFPVAADFVLHLGLLHNAAVSSGFIVLLLLFLAVSAIRNNLLSTTAAIVVSVFGHWLIGGLIYVFPLLLMLEKRTKRSLILGLVLLIVVLVVPSVLRANYLLTVEQVYLFPAFDLKSLLPPAVLVLVTVAALPLERIKPVKPSFIRLPVAIALTVFFAWGMTKNGRFNQEKIFALDTETYRGNPDRVIALAEKMGHQNRVATYYTNMALAQKGQLPERLFDFYQPGIHGLILPVSQYENWLTILFSNELFYLLGDMNLAQHSSMLGMTFSPYQRGSRMTRRLAEINMVNEDYPGAEKFLRMLEKTLFHKKWAKQKLAENHAGSESRWLTEKRKQTAKADTIRTSFDYIGSIEFLVAQNPGNLVAVDYLLCYHLLNKDLAAFKTAYDRYGKNIDRPVPKVYAEALLITLFRDQAPQEVVAGYRIRSQQLTDFMEYTRQFEQTRGEVEDLQKKYGKTYWFYYHFATFKQDTDDEA